MAKTPLADWIYRFRALHLQKTQADFAVMLRVTLNAVQRWEAGARTPMGPTLVLLEKLACEHDFEPPPEVATGRGPRLQENEAR